MCVCMYMYVRNTFFWQVEHLVRQMREVQRDRAAARQRGANARAYVVARYEAVSVR